MNSSSQPENPDIHAPATDSAPEYSIKNYRIGKTIGEGTFGKVKMGIHIPTREKVLLSTDLLFSELINNNRSQ